MASTEPSNIIVCPSCSARFAVAPSMAGHRGRCAACNAAFIVPTPAKAAAIRYLPPTKRATPDSEPPEYISVECRVCGTRMHDRPDQVGKQLKCPDCGALTVLPTAPKPKLKNMPAALEGEQYELWEVDDQPLPSALIASQPTYVAVQCRKCATLMYPTEKQVGQQIVCPDCGTKHIVPPPPKPVAERSVLAPDRETPRLDPAAAPGERPATFVSSYRMLHEERAEAEYAQALEKSKRTGKPMEIDSRGRPVIPRWPLVTGIVPFLFSRGVPAIWLALSVGFYAAGWVFFQGLEMASSGGMGAVAGMSFFALGCILAMICAAATSSMLMQIIMESSEGNREIHHWPSFLDWFGSLLYLGVSGSLCMFPAWAISFLPPFQSNPELTASAAALTGLLCLPIMVLSQLDIDSPWGILSARILASTTRCPFSWAFFYFENTVLVAICGAATFFAAARGPTAILWLTPLYLAALILFARLLGRLAWLLSEAIPVDDPSEDEQRAPGAKNYNPPR